MADSMTLKDCIMEILLQKKKTEGDWGTLMTLFDAIRKQYPSVMDNYQLIDVREIVTTSELVERNDIYFRLSDNADYQSEPAEEKVTVNEIAESEEYLELYPIARDCSISQINEVKDIPIEALELSVRSYHGLRRAHINYIGDLIKLEEKELMNLENIGAKSCKEILDKVHAFLKGDDVNLYYGNEKKRTAKSEKKVIGGRLIDDIPLEELGLSVRAYNCFKRANIYLLSQIVVMSEEQMLSLHNMGVGTVKEVIEKINDLYESGIIVADQYEAEAQRILNNYYESEEFTESVLCEVKNIIQKNGHNAITREKIISRVTIQADEDILRNAVSGALERMSENQELVYESGGYYYNYPSVYDAIKVLAENHQAIIKERLQGKTLNEIGNDKGITRERVRQIIATDLNRLKLGSKKIVPIFFFKEDKYKYLYEGYDISIAEWLSIIQKEEYMYHYLQSQYKRGSLSLVYAVDDDQIEVEIRKRIQAKNDENYIIVGNKRIPKIRKKIEDYVLFRYFKDGGTVDEFFETYNSFLKENDVVEESLIATDEVKRTRENRISGSMKVLWKQNRRLRYYDIEGTDFQELLEALDLSQYENTELSTLKFIYDYPELMQKYDIRDEYELHNLLKKICDPADYNEISFGRMPGIVFGVVDRDEKVKELLNNLAPISQEDFVATISEKYGYKPLTIKANWLDCINEYYINGEYHTEAEDDQILTDEQLCKFDDQLTENFYFDDEVSRIYSRIIGEKGTPKPYVIKKLGFNVRSGYIFRGADTANEFFTRMLTEKDVVDLSVYGSKLHYLISFSQIEYALREEYEILEFEPYQYLNIRRLKEFGVEKRDIVSYCGEVKKFVDDDSYFTIPWLRKNGFYSKLENLGFGDFFYESILSLYPGITASINRRGERAGSVLLKTGERSGSKTDFMIAIIEEKGSIDRDELIEYCFNNYNIVIPDNIKYQGIFENSDVYYDSIMGKYYANYSLYFDEV